jgi:hypothetical protein
MTPNFVEVEQNYAAFALKLPGLLKTRRGKFALMHRGDIIGFFDTLGDAVRSGKLKFDQEYFSVQEVTDRSVNLGHYSYALRNVAL